jgi:hypothetical protein
VVACVFLTEPLLYGMLRQFGTLPNYSVW